MLFVKEKKQSRILAVQKMFYEYTPYCATRHHENFKDRRVRSGGEQGLRTGVSGAAGSKV